MESDYIIYAKKMLGTGELPQELLEKLHAINSLVLVANDEVGGLRSSQIVAMIVYDYFMKENLGK